MSIATLTSRGRVTLPIDVRTVLRLSAGDRVDFVPLDGGFMLVPVRNEVSTLKGRFAGRVSKPVSINAMKAIAAGMTLLA